jgi:arylsulfatase A-like enzyme
MTPGWKDEEVDLRFTEKALEFIETSHDEHPDRPFFLYLTPSAPHRPCTAPEFLQGKSQAGPRGDMVMVVDWVVGQVLSILDRLALADDTLLIVTSDNGARPADVDGNTYGHKSCGDLRGYKGDIWDGGHREPFVACWPKVIKPGTVSDETICLADFMATTAAITDTELPQYAAEDSYNFLPALLAKPPRRPVRATIVHHSVDGMFSIREGKWKLIQGRGSGGFSEPARIIPGPGELRGQLYDMENDTAEMTNLWKQNPEIVAKLLGLLARYKRRGYSREILR